MAEKAYIVEAVRTAGGKKDGLLSKWHPSDLGAKVLDEIVNRLDMDPAQQAIHFAIQAVMSGTQDIVIGGGVEVMSIVPIGASVIDGMDAGHGFPFDSNGMKERYPGVFFSQFTGAELVAKKWDLSREDLDQFALESHQKAVIATESNFFDKKLNVNGGAMALGHPLGATGAKLMTTMLHELERRNGRYALQAICEGGGTANATIIKRV